MTGYRLNRDVYMCQVDGHAMFLNLRNDEYLSLPPDQSRKLAIFLKGELLPADETGDNTVQALLAEMQEAGLLTRHPKEGKMIAPMEMNLAGRDLGGYRPGEEPRVRVGHVVHFFRAAFISLCRLRWEPLHRTVHRLRKHKHKWLGLRVLSSPGPQDCELEQIRELVEIFNFLQPLLFTGRNRCLFQSLALLEFLAGYGIFPDWVFGVKMKPFVAHCWLQTHGVVLNDTVDHVSLYTPIMIV